METCKLQDFNNLLPDTLEHPRDSLFMSLQLGAVLLARLMQHLAGDLNVEAVFIIYIYDYVCLYKMHS